MGEKVKRPHVLEAIETVQTELAKVGIAKDRKNAGQGFSFRGIDQVLTTLSGLLAANRVVLVCREPVSASGFAASANHHERRETKNGGNMYVTILTRRVVAVSLVDGSELDMGTYSGEGADSGDKATSKAHSMLYKYAAFLGFCIPLEGVLDDSDADSPQDAPAASKKPGKAAKVAEPQDDEDEEPEAPQATEPTKKGKGKKAKPEADEIDTALARIAALDDVDDIEPLAKELRGLKAHERFAEVKAALKAKIVELSEED